MTGFAVLTLFSVVGLYLSSVGFFYKGDGNKLLAYLVPLALAMLLALWLDYTSDVHLIF